MPIPSQTELQTHRQFLKFQRELERSIEKLHDNTEKALNKIIARNTNAQGVISKYKIKRIVDKYMDKEIRQYRQQLQSQIRGGVSKSTDIGIRSIFAAVAPNRKISALIWKKTAKSIRKQITSMRGIDGLTLSERIWKLSGDNMHQIKKLTSSGILQGRSAAAISRDIRGFLIRPATLRGRARDLLSPGRGVYRSAYKNAMRITRTETANAYLLGQVETAKKTGYNLLWNLSAAHNATGCQCESLVGNVYTPETIPARPHPQCMCYMTNVPRQ